MLQRYQDQEDPNSQRWLQIIYEKLLNDISERHILLLDPILGPGNSAVQAINLLISKGVPEGNIVFLNLISAPQGVHVVSKKNPRIKIVTSEIDNGLTKHFVLFLEWLSLGTDILAQTMTRTLCSWIRMHSSSYQLQRLRKLSNGSPLNLLLFPLKPPSRSWEQF